MTAREWLALVRMACHDIEGARRALAALEEARETCTSWSPGGGGSHGLGTHSDPTASEAQRRILSLDAQIDEAEARVDELERLIGDGLRVIAAVRMAVGDGAADAIEVYYVDRAPTWSDVAHELGVTRETVRVWRDRALAWLDEVGVETAASTV